MPENVMFEKIRSDFLAGQELANSDTTLLHTFCEYATKWLAEKGLVGIGQTTNGMSLRFANGDEYLLTTSPLAEAPPSFPAVSIIGNNGGSVRGSGAIQDNSIRIIG